MTGFDDMLKHARLTAALLAGAALGLAGCTSSLGPSAIPNPYGTDTEGAASVDTTQFSLGGADPVRGSGTVDVVVPASRPLPDQLVKDIKSATGYTLTQQQIDLEQLDSSVEPGGIDLALGIDSYNAARLTETGRVSSTVPAGSVSPDGTALTGAPGAVAFGRDDVCVLADDQWFQANKAAMPVGFDDLTKKEFASRLWIADPATSSTGRAFVQATDVAWGQDAGAKWGNLVREGATIGSTSEFAGLDAILHDHPLVLASRIRGAATMRVGSSTDTVSWQGPSLTPIESTCIARPLYAALSDTADNADGAVAVVNYLQSGAGQYGIAATGTGYAVPLAPGAADGTLLGQFALPTPAEDGTYPAVALPADTVAKTPGLIDRWKAATGR